MSYLKNILMEISLKVGEGLRFKGIGPEMRLEIRFLIAGLLYCTRGIIKSGK